MGVLHRIKALISGFINNATRKVEDNNPELLIEDAQNNIQKSRKDAEKQLIEIKTWAEMIRIDVKDAERKLSDIRGRIDAAAELKNKELLTSLFLQEEEYEKVLAERKQLHESAVAEAYRVRDYYRKFETETRQRMKELSLIRSQTQIVVMREKMTETYKKYGSYGTGYGTSQMQSNIEELRKRINERCARVIAIEQLRQDSIDEKVRDTDFALAERRAAQRADALLIERK